MLHIRKVFIPPLSPKNIYYSNAPSTTNILKGNV